MTKNKLKPFTVQLMSGSRSGKSNDQIRAVYLRYYEQFLKGKCMPEIEIQVVDHEKIRDLERKLRDAEVLIESIADDEFNVTAVPHICRVFVKKSTPKSNIIYDEFLEAKHDN